MAPPCSNDMQRYSDPELPLQGEEESPSSPNTAPPATADGGQTLEPLPQKADPEGEEEIFYLMSRANGFRPIAILLPAGDLIGSGRSQPTSAAVPHVPNVFVEHMSLEGRTAEAKVQELRRGTDHAALAGREQAAGSSASPSVQDPASSSTRLIPGPTSLFSIPAVAPPAYTPSQTSAASSSQRNQSPYQTFPPPSSHPQTSNLLSSTGSGHRRDTSAQPSANMGSGEETRWLLSRYAPPQSMSDQSGGGDGGEVYGRRKAKMSSRCRRVINFLFFALMFLVIGTIIGIVTNTAWRRKVGISILPLRHLFVFPYVILLICSCFP